jgi:hypothetical protein
MLMEVECDEDGRIGTHLRMPILTMARTTAFMPALSPPEVRTASFILPVDWDIAGVTDEEGI